MDGPCVDATSRHHFKCTHGCCAWARFAGCSYQTHIRFAGITVHVESRLLRFPHANSLTPSPSLPPFSTPRTHTCDTILLRGDDIDTSDVGLSIHCSSHDIDGVGFCCVLLTAFRLLHIPHKHVIKGHTKEYIFLIIFYHIFALIMTKKK